MDNITLVRRYITKNFNVYVDDRFRIKDLHTGGTIKLGSLSDETEQIFGCDCTKIIDEWYAARMRQETKDIHEYLDKYRVDLGNINWIVLDNNNNEFSIRQMVKDFEGIYDEKFIRDIQNDWYIKKIYKNTEDRLKFQLIS